MKKKYIAPDLEAFDFIAIEELLVIEGEMGSGVLDEGEEWN